MEKATPYGGDGLNYYMFYCGADYKCNSVDAIAAYAKEMLTGLKNLTLKEIKLKHMYWGSEGLFFKGVYNGDTWVVFDKIDELPQSMMLDAYSFCEWYKNKKGF